MRSYIRKISMKSQTLILYQSILYLLSDFFCACSPSYSTYITVTLPLYFPYQLNQSHHGNHLTNRWIFQISDLVPKKKKLRGHPHSNAQERSSVLKEATITQTDRPIYILYKAIIDHRRGLRWILCEFFRRNQLSSGLGGIK